MTSHFSATFFSNNRNKLRQLMDAEIIVASANGQLQRTADTTYPFQQDSNFWYLTGISEPNILLVMEGTDSYLIVPELSEYQSIFDGITSEAELSSISGVTTILDETAGWERLSKALQKRRQVATLATPPAYIDVYGMYTNPARTQQIERMKDVCPELDVVNIRTELAELRVYKQAAELAAMRQAIDVTTDAIQSITKRLKAGDYTYEYQIEADLNHAFRATGANGHAFAPIISSGKRACLLHNVSNNGAVGPEDLVLVDIGAEVEHYAADISRTLSAGQPSKRQQAVHDAVRAVQTFALTRLTPGTDLKEYEQQVEVRMGEELQKLGLITEASHTAIRAFFPHATSHFLGLDVHDVGERQQMLEPGMVLTCEPGIYIAKEGIGVRIEDDVLITEHGNTVLTAALSAAIC